MSPQINILSNVLINDKRQSELEKLLAEPNDTSVEDLIKDYFSLGFNYREILAYLNILHNKPISYRTLKRKLSKLNLYRKKNYSSIRDVANFMDKEIERSSQLHGYRWLHLKCLQNNFVVTQNIVRELLICLDPKGVEIRKRKRLRRRQYFNKGPNYLWHMDCYDKLKPYGICISGCIDGFSRNIIWLRTGSTSSDPKVIAGYFIDALKLVNGYPKCVRADYGTENGTVAKIQNSLNELLNESTSNKPAFLYGTSTHNQRIEGWWGILRKHISQFWINLFEMLKEENIFDGSVLDKYLIQFCFMKIIQRELDQVVLEWNTHKIHSSRNSISPCGRPCIMFDMPSLYGTKDYKMEVPEFILNQLKTNCTFLKYTCDEDFHRLCNILMIENGLYHENEPYGALDLYKTLRELLKEVFN